MNEFREAFANARGPIRYAPATAEFFKKVRRELLTSLSVMDNSSNLDFGGISEEEQN